jgi:DNA-directed RNA polymerase subunit RPC12/RpoP
MKKFDRKFYLEYLQSEEWCAKRMHIAKLNNYVCQNCNRKTFVNFHIHHLTYMHLGNELDNELVFLCSNCHKNIHNIEIEEKEEKCLKCNGELEIKIYRNKGGHRQQGLYCKNCSKYYKFLKNKELGEYFKKGYSVNNTYGSLAATKLNKYME